MIETDLPAIVERAGFKFVKSVASQGGATCSAYFIETQSRPLFLRVFNRRERRTPLAVEIAVVDQLRSQGLPVTEPVLSSVESPDLWPGLDWALDIFLDGAHPRRGGLTATAAQDVGRVLAALHGMELEGVENLPGVSERFDAPLPIGLDVKTHLLVQARPDLADKVCRYVDLIRTVENDDCFVPCHGDLHERQVLLKDGAVQAVLDFGELSYMAAGWDLGSFAYFQGQECLRYLLDGYCENAVEREELFEQGLMFSAGIALHHASRSRLPGKEDRLARACHYLDRLS